MQNWIRVHTQFCLLHSPKTANDMLTFTLDMKGINVSGGSACTSGSNQGSHVIRALGPWTADYQPVRVSFSKFNTKDCAEGFLSAVREIYAVQQEA